MSDQHHDWLDQHLAASPYIPDDGFTARVITHLPKKAAPAISLRQRILFLSAFLSTCLVAVLIGPLVSLISESTSRAAQAGTVDHVIGLAQQPMVLYCVAGGLLVASVASIPFLRRWV